MKTIMVFASGIILMFVMYIYFLVICLYALIALPFKKVSEVIKSSSKVNQLAGA
jgi:hypothetical protein